MGPNFMLTYLAYFCKIDPCFWIQMQRRHTFVRLLHLLLDLWIWIYLHIKTSACSIDAYMRNKAHINAYKCIFWNEYSRWSSFAYSSILHFLLCLFRILFANYVPNILEHFSYAYLCLFVNICAYWVFNCIFYAHVIKAHSEVVWWWTTLKPQNRTAKVFHSHLIARPVPARLLLLTSKDQLFS